MRRRAAAAMATSLARSRSSRLPRSVAGRRIVECGGSGIGKAARHAAAFLLHLKSGVYSDTWTLGLNSRMIFSAAAICSFVITASKLSTQR